MFLECQVRDSRHLLRPPDEFLGRNIRDVLPPDLAERLVACFGEALKSDQPVSLEYSISTGGELRFYEVRAVGTDNDQVLSLVRDITDQTRRSYRRESCRTSWRIPDGSWRSAR